VLVVLDRCRDGTERVARAHGADVLRIDAPGGKVEALRAGMTRARDVHLCIDADVLVGARALLDLVSALVAAPHVLATCPPLEAIRPRRLHTPLAWALHRYNARRGFSRERLWLSGRCYAVRYVEFPSIAELRTRAAQAGARWEGPLLADDVWLSRSLLARGAQSVVHVETDPVRFRPPATMRGMSRTFRRLRRELACIDALFPELPGPGRDRRVDAVDDVGDAVALAIFRAGLVLCRLHASIEDWLAQRRIITPDPWPVVRESKS